MAPWDEWEQLKADAAAPQSTGMQLNKLAAPRSGGGHAGPVDDSALVFDQDDLGAVGHEAFMLHDRLRNGADIAGAGMDKDGAGSTMQAAAALQSHAFALGAELTTTVTVWDSQLKSLLQACAHISNHLNFSKKLHDNDDAQISASLRQRDGTALPISKLSEYFK